MRYLRYAFWGSLGVILVAVALANRDLVTLRLLPAELSGWVGLSWAVELPLFVVIFGAIIAGLLIGFVWEWFREHRIRADAARKGREVNNLRREVHRLKGRESEGKDEVLALLDGTR